MNIFLCLGSDGDLVVTIIKKKLIDIIVDGVRGLCLDEPHVAEGWDATGLTTTKEVARM